MGRGGKREGSGRKRRSLEEKRVQLSTYVAPETKEALREISRKQKKSVGRVLDMMMVEKSCTNEKE